MKNTLSARMKEYEYVSRIYLTKKNPVIIRIDGKDFHTFTRDFILPFDKILMKSMQYSAKYLCENICGCKLAYIQSDEISLLLTDYDTKDTQPWFGNNLQKLVSVASSMATLAFNRKFYELTVCNKDEDALQNATETNLLAYSKANLLGAAFDARAFILPKEEVCNYFVWRQQDATKNSILTVAQYYFSQSEIEGKSCNKLQDMLFTCKNINWNNFSIPEKRGCCVVKKVETDSAQRIKWAVDENIPIFTKNKAYINRHVYVNCED